MSRFGKHISILSFGLLVTGMAFADTGKDDEVSLPFPERRTELQGYELQRVRFYNAPLKRDAQEALKHRNFAAAAASLEKILAHDPESNYARHFLVETYDQLGRPADAIRICRELVANYPDYTEGHRKLAYLAIRTKDYPLAAASFEQLLRRLPPTSAERMVVEKSLAHLAFLTGETEKAKQYGQMWLQEDPSREARRFLAEVAIKQEDWPAAAEMYDALLADAPSNAERGELLLRKGYADVKRGRLDSANATLAEARTLLSGQKRQLEIEQQLGFNAMILDQPLTAANHFKTLLNTKFTEENARAYLDALSSAEQWELARVEAASFLRREDISVGFRESSLKTRLYAQLNLGDDRGFIESARELYNSFPDPRYLIESAAAARRLNDSEAAASLYKEYLAKKFDGNVAMDLYYLLKNLARYDESRALLEDLLARGTLDPKVQRAASYELAQIYRTTGRMDEYFKMVGMMLREKNEPALAKEYAVHLYGAGRYDEAMNIFAMTLDSDVDPTEKFATTKLIAEISLALNKPKDAKAWLDRALSFGEADDEWQVIMARADYTLGDYRACVDRLLPLAGRGDAIRMYLGFAFYQLKMPGLALLQLSAVEHSDELSPAERYNLFANRAYLQFDQDQYAGAVSDCEKALEYRFSRPLELVRMKSLVRLNQHEEAVKAGKNVLKKQDESSIARDAQTILKDFSDKTFATELVSLLREPEAAFRSDVYQTMGLAYFRMNQNDDALRTLTQALHLNPKAHDALYLRGLAYFKNGQYKEAKRDFIEFFNTAADAASVPATFWGDLGNLGGDLKDYDLGTAALSASRAAYPYDIDSGEESGYQFLKWNQRDDAQEAFKGVIGQYNRVIPYLEGKDRAEYEENRQSMRKEFSKLDKSWGTQAYISRTEDTGGGDIPLQTIEGALPAQAGIQAAYRPPKIGFRNEKTLDIFGRVLANFEPESWDLNEDSYQGGIGIVYKPLALYNFNVSIERLFKIGDDAENNWLWRNAASWERGEKAIKNESSWLWPRVYGEISYFLDEPERWIYYLDARLGLSMSIKDRMILTFPQAIGVGRYQSDDETGLGTYGFIGLGGNFRMLEREKDLVTERWYLDAYAHYVWGRFEEIPESFEEKDFEGLILGVSFVK